MKKLSLTLLIPALVAISSCTQPPNVCECGDQIVSFIKTEKPSNQEKWDECQKYQNSLSEKELIEWKLSLQNCPKLNVALEEEILRQRKV